MKTVLLLLSILLSTLAHAQVDITLDSPDTFTDLESARNTQIKTFADFEKTLARELTPLLAEGKHLRLIIQDVDQAGRIDHFPKIGTKPVRVVKDLDKASIKFEYEIVDKSGNVEQAGQLTLKELNPKIDIKDKHRRSDFNFYYVVKLMKEWLQDGTLAS